MFLSPYFEQTFCHKSIREIWTTWTFHASWDVISSRLLDAVMQWMPKQVISRLNSIISYSLIGTINGFLRLSLLRFHYKMLLRWRYQHWSCRGRYCFHCLFSEVISSNGINQIKSKVGTERKLRWPKECIFAVHFAHQKIHCVICSICS